MPDSHDISCRDVFISLQSGGNFIWGHLTCPGTLSWHHSVAEFQRHEPSFWLLELFGESLLCSEVFRPRSATDIPKWTSPPILPGPSLNPRYLKLWVLALSSKPHPWAFGSQWTTVFPELLWCQLSADSSGCSFFLEPPFRIIFTLCPQNLTLSNNWMKGSKWGHIIVTFLKVPKHAQATRIETHTLVPFTHQSTSTLLNGIFCNREGTLSSNLSVCFYQPWVLASLLTDMANYSLEIMLLSHLWWGGVRPQNLLTHMLPFNKTYVAWSKHQTRDSGGKKRNLWFQIIVPFTCLWRKVWVLNSRLFRLKGKLRSPSWLSKIIMDGTALLHPLPSTCLQSQFPFPKESQGGFQPENTLVHPHSLFLDPELQINAFFLTS